MSYNLFLDDFRTPEMALLLVRDKRYTSFYWITVKNYEEFVAFIKNNGVPDLVSFDHDLGFEHYDLRGNTNYLSWDEYYVASDREMTGYDCAKWLCDYCLENQIKLPEYIVHSANTVGANNIRRYINNFLKHNPKLK